MVAITILALPEESAAAGALGDALAQAFGPRALPPTPTPPSSWTARVVIVLIGPGWPDAMLQPPHQRLRFVLSALLHRPGAALVLPVLVRDGPIPSADSLPPDLTPLALLQVMAVRSAPEFVRDVEAVILRIRIYEQSVRQAHYEQGNFLAFKLFSFMPLAALITFVLVTAILQVNSAQDLTPAQYALTFPLASIIFLTLFALWPVAAIVALVTRRYRWALVNGLAPPTSLALAPLALVADRLPQLWGVALAGLVVTSWIVAWMLLPIVFGLTLPPHRQKKA